MAQNAKFLYSLGALSRGISLDTCAQRRFRSESSLGAFRMVKNAKFLHSSGAHVRSIPLDTCAQRRFRSDCAFAQSDQNPHLAHYEWPYAVFFIRWVHMAEGMDSHIATRLSLLAFISNLFKTKAITITKTPLFEYIENFTSKNGKLSRRL